MKTSAHGSCVSRQWWREAGVERDSGGAWQQCRLAAAAHDSARVGAAENAGLELTAFAAAKKVHYSKPGFSNYCSRDTNVLWFCKMGGVK